MSRNAGEFGIRPGAMNSWLALSDALNRITDDGRQAICATRPDQWSGDATEPARKDAAEACGFCPARAACLAFAQANDERSGVWGAVDFTPKPKRKAA
jgi:hypothetical protein